jgi:tetratricopeptide (TPR) repeat protein
MPGRVLAEGFTTPAVPGRITTWEADSPLSPPDEDAAEMIACLTGLGYVDSLEETIARRQASAEIDGAFFLACSHLASDGPSEAVPLLERVALAEPDHPYAGFYLAYAYLAAGRLTDCAAQLQRLPGNVLTELIRARLTMCEGRVEEAIASLERIEAQDEPAPFVGCMLGDAYRASGRYADAARCYQRVIAKDGGIAVAHLGLAQSLYAQRQFEAATEAALEASRLRYDLAPAHMVLGASLMRLGLHGSAATALQTCLKLAPETQQAAHLLARIHASRVSNAAHHSPS